MSRQTVPNVPHLGSATILQSAAVTGLNIAHQFLYDTSAEMKQVTTPLGGVLKWIYAKYSYTARNYMGVWKRSMNTGANGFSDTVYIGSDSNPNWHLLRLVTDMGAGTQKSWTFSGSSDYTAGLVTGYQEIETTGAVLLQKTYSWAANLLRQPLRRHADQHAQPRPELRRDPPRPTRRSMRTAISPSSRSPTTQTARREPARTT